MDDASILKTLNAIGNDMVKEMRGKVKLNGSYASGWLYNSFKSYAKQKTNGEFMLEIDYVYYGFWVDGGRRPGKFPPLDDIRQWCRLKGIPEDAAYPIAKKIAERGYKAKPFTTNLVDNYKTISDIMTEMGKAFSNDIVKQINEDAKYFNKKK